MGARLPWCRFLHAKEEEFPHKNTSSVVLVEAEAALKSPYQHIVQFLSYYTQRIIE